MQKSLPKFSGLIVAFLGLPFLLGYLLYCSDVFAIDNWNEGYDVNNNTTEAVEVTSARNCSIVNNSNTGNKYFIPTKTQDEWNNLTSNLPTNISLQHSNWSPNPSNYCSYSSVVQANQCGATKTVMGTKCCDTSWSPARERSISGA